jgi:hypothetical protein
MVYYTLIQLTDMKKIIYISFCLLTFAMGSCKKNTVTQISTVATGAQLKFVQAVPGIPAVDEFVNGVKISPQQNLGVTDNSRATSVVTGIAYPSAFSTALQYGAMFPGGSSTNYAAVPAGNDVIKIATSTPVPALVSPQTLGPNATISTVTQALTDRTPYTVFTIGFPDKITTVVVQDKFTGADTTKAYVRFANFIPNSTPLDVKGTYTLTGTTTAVTVTAFTNIAFGTVTDFLPVTVSSTTSTGYVFAMFQTGTATGVGAAAKSISLGANRYYTIVANGLVADYPVPGTTITLKASARPTLPASLLPEIYFTPPGISYYINR